MKSVSKRELNENTAAVLEQVVGSRVVVVTDPGKPQWQIRAFRDGDARLSGLEREGRYTPAASDPAPWSTDPDPVYTSDQLDELLSQMRGDH
ncbi:hypothetical protein [Branchiibius sp. NY16-3462-2]|uniref:hypothetical protein n=1 Tax=Branchiibius sp. NY16-3462-2 TaxID=1807500 RepID=UPI0007916D76|nr:hypothetical protein [Branchiibius sp. NY16-3462-2]KYH46016.1 hypothetical protein AZH51_10195 [Branchiibius sp. NY16-3462-2]